MLRSGLLFITYCLLLLTGCDNKSSKDDILSKIPDPKTLNESYVSNPDQLLAAETVAALNSKLIALDQSGTAHIDVVFVKSIGENVPKEIAHGLFRKWKIGSKTTNNGLLILIVKDQRRIEFETGYGLEGILPDMVCKRIQEDHMVPHARNNNFDLAVTDGVEALISRLKSSRNETFATSDPSAIHPDMPVMAPPAVDLPPIDLPVTDSTAQTAYPSDNRQPTLQQETVKQRSAPAAGWITLIIFVIYAAFAWPLAATLYGHIFKKSWLNPLSYLIAFVPLAFVIYLNIDYPSSWYDLRAVLILLCFLWAYVNLHFLLLRMILNSTLGSKSRHEQYLAWRRSHAPAEYAVQKFFSFPFLKSYWNSYLENQYQRRYAPLNCSKCSALMKCMDEEKEDQFLSKGQLTEEKIAAVDYDVWECSSCKQITILDYSNLKSKVKDCPECHFKTLKYYDRKIIKKASTYGAGYGYEYHICANCKYTENTRFDIAQIPTASSGSSSSGSSSSSSFSSSSSSSSSSTSGGGSSGGGGSGSSW
ncbi:TPM domain-containing protein [Pedobacter heparinus]|uniref:TPM domain-containing protein n=1 Tax=Pedobacter heparinus TaxID=984 RepID=UPI00292D03C5|nr:TPM domain-containing protein [Pedobacter heparinus]